MVRSTVSLPFKPYFSFLVHAVHYLNLGLIIGLSLAGALLLLTVILLIVFRDRLCGGESDGDEKDD